MPAPATPSALPRLSLVAIGALAFTLTACGPPPPPVLPPPPPVEEAAPEEPVEQALIEMPDDEVRARLTLVLALVEDAEWHAALTHLETLRRARRNWIVEYEYAHALYWLNGSVDEVRAALERSMVYNPRNPRALVLLGQLHEDQGDIAPAEDYYRQAIAIRKDELAPHMALARVLRRNDKPKEAVAALERVMEHHPNNTRLLMQLAAAQEASGDVDAAHKSYNRVAHNHNDRLKGETLLYRFLTRIGDTKAATRSATRIETLTQERSQERTLRPLLPSAR